MSGATSTGHIKEETEKMDAMHDHGDHVRTLQWPAPDLCASCGTLSSQISRQ